MTKKNKYCPNIQLARGLLCDLKEKFKHIIGDKIFDFEEEMIIEFNHIFPFDTPISKKKINRKLNKLSYKWGKILYESLTEEDKGNLTVLNKEFDSEKIDIIEKYQKSDDYWIDEIGGRE